MSDVRPKNYKVLELQLRTKQNHGRTCSIMASSVTRLGDFLHFRQLFKAYGNNYFAQIDHIFMQFFVK